MNDRFRMLPSYHYEDNTDGVLLKSVGKPLRDYLIKGNSIQDGTPSLDNPIEIESVGELTKNIRRADIALYSSGSSYEQYGNGFKATAKINTGGYSNYVRDAVLLDFEWGKTYTFSCFFEQSVENMNPLMRVGYIQNTNGSWKDFKSQTTVNNSVNSITVTLPTEKPPYFGENESGTWGSSSIMLFFNIQRNALDDYGTIYVTDIMVNEGDTALPYEPPEKYKNSITVGGKNLWSFGDLEFTKYKEITFSPPLPAGDYIFTADVVSTDTDSSNRFLRFNDVDGNKLGSTYFEDKKKNICHITTNTDITTLLLYASDNYNNGANDICTYSNVQLECGSIATSYEPYREPITTNIYLDEPLRRTTTGNYADYIDYRNSKVVRKIGYYIFKGTEGIAVPGSTITGHTPFRFLDISEARQPFMCNYLPYVASDYGSINSNPRECLAKYSTGNQMFFIVSNDRVPLNDTKSFKQLLSDLYQNNTPLIVYYVKANYSEESIELPEILTQKGTNIISIGTEIQPYAVSYQYYKGGN